MKDVIIIGAGVIGAAIARELARYNLDVAVLEKDYDIANGTSKANSGIIHPGEDPIPGTLKARMNIEGNKLFDQLHKELNFPFKRNGSLVLCFKQEDIDQLEILRQRGLTNGVPKESMKILSRKEALEVEPYLSDHVVAALYLKTGGIVGPYEMNIALAENAAQNGVDFYLDTKVEYILPSKTGFRIGTNRGTFEGQLVINAAGVYADEINNSISQKKYHITARKGEYLLLDKKEVSKTTLFQLPTHLGKGVLVTPTCHGNIILGPTALDIDNKTNVETTREQLDAIMEKVSLTIDTRQLSGVITSFSGLRAHEAQNDFVIGEAEDVPGFINVLGIESPGLTSAPAIGKYVAQIVEGKLKPSINLNFNPIREGIRSFKEASEEERKKLVDQDKKYGHIVCRCETITEAEILQAIRGPLGAKTVDGVKRRTRAGMGRCQGGFCMNRIVELLAEELHIELEEVRKNTAGSELLVADLKEGLEE